ncbi:glycosyl hydrolase family 88 [Bacteroides sp. CAG:754]|nr:glycosyl hydrolase family 88 [Bacteroides sp. CAG:754]
MVDGKTQSAGSEAKAIVLRKEFTEEKDLFSIDYTSAYSTPNLDKLIRTFVYDRQGEGSFTVSDEFTADTPIRFETAITTQADWKVLDDTRLLLTSGTEQMIVNIEASGKVAFTSETIEVNAPAYTRIGIALKEQSEKGYIRLKMQAKQL